MKKDLYYKNISYINLSYKTYDRYVLTYWYSEMITNKLYSINEQKIMTLLIKTHWVNYDFETLFDWCVLNCKKDFGYTMYNNWLFEDKEDSIQFALRWM